jgi:hypothetical protein
MNAPVEHHTEAGRLYRERRQPLHEKQIYATVLVCMFLRGRYPSAYKRHETVLLNRLIELENRLNKG